MTNPFVHLHVHSEYSLLDGLPKIAKLVSRTKELGMPAIALTDHGVMYGAMEFYKECLKESIKPIIGMEAYIVNNDHHSKTGKSDAQNLHLTLLSSNYTGYKNLMRIASIAHLEGYYYKPRISKDVLKNHAEGLVCLSGCGKSELGQLLAQDRTDASEQALAWYRQVFGNNFYLEIQRHQYDQFLEAARSVPKISDRLKEMQATEDLRVANSVKLSRKHGIPIVATNDVHYLTPSDATAQDALVCISTGKTISEVDRLRYVDTPTFYLRSPEEMGTIFSDLPDSVANSVKIAESCELKIELGKWYFPKIELPDRKPPPETLRAQAETKLSEKFPDSQPEVRKRLDFELDVIISKGYAPYFLMMADLVNWCTDHGIITNTRGSAAGSIVSYILGITSVDPIKYGLPFERFLNPYRPKPPDIDLDVADDRREEVIAYITSRYGQEKVAQIATFGRMLARAAVRDVARVLGHPYAVGDRIAKTIPLGSQGFPMTIEHALDVSPELKILYDTDPQSRQILNLAKEIEGNARHASVHAAGIVVSPGPMTDYSPLQLEPNGDKIITQYEMHACEDVGLVKFDILGIRNLSILSAARDIIEKIRSTKIDLDKIPLDDKKVYSMLARGETMGTFQLGGPGMTKWLKELKPNRLEDIMVMIALFRPGPMANIPEYIARKNKKSSIHYLHLKMASFLDKSYGILVYQEDVLFTAIELAGYNWETVDALRQAIGKKKPKEMAQQHEIFVKGCIKTSNMTAQEAEKIWELFVPFQGYGFNKAHAASYGIVAYQTAYLKAHYSVEYMTALLTAESGNTEKIVEAIEECRRMKINVLPPDVNKSDTIFTIEHDPSSRDDRAIRFGLSAIKNVGVVAIHTIISARRDGEFRSLTDFVNRVDSQKVNRKVLESLIKAGAMDEFGPRSAQLAALDQIKKNEASLSRTKSLGQSSLFPDIFSQTNRDILPNIPEFEQVQKLSFEKELLGFYLTAHPHSQNLKELNAATHLAVSDLYTGDYIGKLVTTGGVIESVRNVTAKLSNQPMCFAKISDLAKSVEVVVFPKIFAATSILWHEDNLVLLSGKVESRNPDSLSEDSSVELTIIANSAAAFTGPDTKLAQPEENHQNPKTTSIEIPKGTFQSTLIKLNTLLQNHRGNQPAELIFLHDGNSKTISLPYGLNWTPELKKSIAGLFNP